MQQASLVIVKQGSLATETLSKNGLQKKVHVVVKNQPFVVLLGIAGSEVPVSMDKYTLEPRLLYDNEIMKEVDFVKHKPLEMVKTMPGESGEQINMELKLKVLTSQLEDMLFRIRFNAYEIEGNKRFTIVSEPIKVVSKPEQVKKSNKKQASITQPHPSTKKRDLNETLVESLVRIEANMEQYSNLVQRQAEITQIQQDSQTALVDSLTQQILVLQERDKNVKHQKVASPFQTAFEAFLVAFEKTPAELRAAKIRKAARTAPKDTETLLCDLQTGMSDLSSSKLGQLDEKGTAESMQKATFAPWFPEMDSFFPTTSM